MRAMKCQRCGHLDTAHNAGGCLECPCSLPDYAVDDLLEDGDPALEEDLRRTLAEELDSETFHAIEDIEVRRVAPSTTPEDEATSIEGEAK